MVFPLKKNGISYTEASLTVLVVFLLTIFCRVAGFSLLIPFLLFFAGLQLHLFRKAGLKMFLDLGLLLALLLFTAHAIATYTHVSVLLVPVASVGMMTMLLFNDLQVAFVMALVSSAVVSLALGWDLGTMLIFFVGGLTASYTVQDARTRGKLISTGLYVSIIQVICLVLLKPDVNSIVTKGFLLDHARPLFLNGFISAFAVMATLKIFESLFGILTNFTLLELSDFNQPLLKRMVLEAPGTYHHSLIVSNLSESGADAIGANALLTRVGAYYHDIGKLEKSEYFTENQLVGGNKHDNIEPSISRLVILGHVKEGQELARKYKLNRMISDFIPQHHGTSLMYFFYQKALEEAEDANEVKEENYRYPGPKPQSRETAIVLLADSVEAATRSLDEPNPPKIEELVRKIINNKFIDGQLDECNLTLKEIEIIAVTFTRVLSAMYHGRVKYPEKKNDSDDRNRKSAEANPAVPRQDPPDHQDRSPS